MTLVPLIEPLRQLTDRALGTRQDALSLMASWWASACEMQKVAAFERSQRRAASTIDHVVAGLSFGFWLSLLNSSMCERLWSGNIRPVFPHLPPNLHQPDVHKRLEKLRLFRNAVMHHYAIFDKGTSAEWENIKLILELDMPSHPRTSYAVGRPKESA